MVPGTIWENRTYGSKDRLVVDLQNNLLFGYFQYSEPSHQCEFKATRNPLRSSANRSRSHDFVDPVLMIMWNFLEALPTPQMFVQFRCSGLCREYNQGLHQISTTWNICHIPNSAFYNQADKASI
ncbi:uncharacterized protein LOC116246868 [Nymphaea colorata]|nr:uncharacterized protein LOC116246868 [Nymphaea colorata]